MTRPTNKAELLEQATWQFATLQALMAQLSADEQWRDFSFVVTEKDKEAHWTRDKNLRDVLVHLHEWHGLLLTWVDNNWQSASASPTPFLPTPYTWKNYRGMNENFTARHQTTTFEDAKALLERSHAEVLQLIGNFSDEELFTKTYFNWSGTTSVGAYCVSATSSHYDWAMKKIKRQLKVLGK